MQSPRVGVGVLIFNAEQQILLGERRNSHGEGRWSPPGGHLEFGETFADCAIRETQEETGLQIVSPTLLGVTNDVFREEGKHYVTILMRGDYPEGQEVRNLEPHKTSDWRWFGMKELPEKLFLPLANWLSQAGLPSPAGGRRECYH